MSGPSFDDEIRRAARPGAVPRPTSTSSSRSATSASAGDAAQTGRFGPVGDDLNVQIRLARLAHRGLAQLGDLIPEMASRVNVDVIPALARPAEIEKPLAEAIELRTRYRQAQEEVAAAQAALDEAERQDVEAAAQRARSGQPIGSVPFGITKASALEAAKRTSSALALALQGFGRRRRRDRRERRRLGHGARRRGRAGRDDGQAAIEALRTACQRIGGALAAKGWINEGTRLGGYHHRATGVWTASVAPTSAKRTANSSPLNAAEIFAYLGELIEPLPTQSRPVLHVAERVAPANAA